jgi:hypothetical protein
MDAIARHDAEIEVRLVLKDRRWVASSMSASNTYSGCSRARPLTAVISRTSISRMFIRTFFTLAIDFVVGSRGKEVEAFGTDSLHERFAAAGQNHHAIIPGQSYCMKQVDKLFMRMT